MNIIKTIAFLIFLSFLAACSGKSDAEKAAAIEKENIESAKQLINSFQFVKHEKSGLCFAYGWEGGPHGGPITTTVPCDKVEKLIK